MRTHNIRLFLYSSLAIVALTLVWGFRQIPAQADLAEEQIRLSLEQELIVISSAVKATTSALKLRAFDVLKSDASTAARALQDSPFAAIALLEADGPGWKTSGFVTKYKDAVDEAKLKAWAAEWPLAKLAGQDSYFTKVTEIDGRAQFAVATPVRRAGEQPAFAVGVFPAAQFGLEFSADRARDVIIFDTKGTALALNRPAYLGSSLRQRPIVKEILESDVLNVRADWTNERGAAMLGLATRISDANLFAAVEARAPVVPGGVLRAWIYLSLCALGTIALNWTLFASLVKPLFAQLAGAEAQIETLRRLMSDQPAVPPPAPDATIAAAELPRMSFIEAPTATPAEEPVAPPPAPVSLGKIIAQALRILEPRLRELDVTIDRIGLDEVAVTNDVLQLQTVIEELLKNSIEAMAEVGKRQLSIQAMQADGRAQVTIEDSGAGIPTEAAKRIFEPFFSTRAQPGGVARGLGLNVVRRIIEEMGGSVLVRNHADRRGCLAELSWPLARRTEVATADQRPVSVESASTSSSRTLSDAELLAADDADLADEEFSAVSVVPRRAGAGVRRPKVRSLE